MALAAADVAHAAGDEPQTVVLYDQNTGDNRVAMVSQNLPDDSYDSQAADDFSVPPGAIWKIKEIDVSGRYQGCCAVSENVFIYQNDAGFPGALVTQCAGVEGIDNHGSFAMTIRKPCVIRLAEGRYWLSVQANQKNNKRIWGWEERKPIAGNPAAWQNPGGGYGKCQSWGTLLNCWDFSGDFMFTLRGSALSAR